MAKDAIPYGMNITASDAQVAMREASKDRAGVNTWTKMLNQAGASFAQETSALTEDYGKAIGEAYKSSLKNQENIDRLGLTGGSRNELLDENRAALMDAYKTYLSKYAEGTATAMQNYGSNVSAIEQALGDEAGNVSKLLNKVYDYYSSWSGGTVSDESMKHMYELFDKYGLGGMFNVEETGLIGDEKQYNYGIKSWDELQNLMYDENRELNTFGKEFYLRALNLSGTEAEGIPSFGRWLAENDPDLLEWYNAPDPYNYTEGGRRSNTIRSLIGGKAGDYTGPLSGSEQAKAQGSLNKDIEQGVKDIINPIEELVAGRNVNEIVEEIGGRPSGYTADLIDAYKQGEEEFVRTMAMIDQKMEGSQDSLESWLQKHGDSYKAKYKEIQSTELKQIPDVKAIDNLRQTYETLYGEGSFDKTIYDDYEAVQSLAKKEESLTREESKELRDKLTSISTKLNNYANLYNGTQIDKSGYVADEHRAENASIALDKIKSAEGSDNYNATVDYAYDKVSKDLTVILKASPSKSRNRDLVIKYSDDEYFTLDKKTGAVPLEHLTEAYQALSKYNDSLLAVYNNGLYMQYKKGEWIRVVPKINGDKGYSDHNKEMNIAKVIAYKMMQNNKMSIRGEDSESSYLDKQVWTGKEIGGK